MAQWSDWSLCSSTCQGGYQSRERHIQVHPEKGGKSCGTSLKETQTCMSEVPCIPGRVDCSWEEWQTWSACNTLDFRYRTRGIAQHASDGGVACTGEVREIGPCAHSGAAAGGACAPRTRRCSWGSWTDWSACSTSCGTGGRRTRERSLQVGRYRGGDDKRLAAVAAGAGPEEEKKFSLSELEAQLQTVEANRTQDALSAFSLGFVSLALLALVLRSAKAGACALRLHLEPGSYDAVPQQLQLA